MIAQLTKLFGCQHRRIGIVVTDRTTCKSTVLCQDCGARMAYDWERMRQGKPQIEHPTLMWNPKEGL